MQDIPGLGEFRKEAWRPAVLEREICGFALAGVSGLTIREDFDYDGGNGHIRSCMLRCEMMIILESSGETCR